MTMVYKEAECMKDLEFPDEFEKDSEICSICGAEAELTGWNEEKRISRFECADCGAIFDLDDDGNETVIKGEERDWEKHLLENLSFPFEARVDEHQGGDGFLKESGPLRYDDKIVVLKVAGESNLYGVVAEIKKGRKTYAFPLCDLAIDDEKDRNYKELENYRDWFANCR